MSSYRLLLKLVLLLLIVLCIKCPFASSRKLRGGSARNITIHRHLNSTDNSLLSITNNCAGEMKVHIRFFDQKMEYITSEGVSLNQKIYIDTDKRITVALVGAERAGSNDVFMPKCYANERGYIKYSDGICYKFYYSSDIGLSCGDDIGRAENGGLRGSGSIATVPLDNDGSTC